MFLTNNNNKAQLINLASDALKEAGHIVKNSHEDADALFVSTALEFATEKMPVLVIATDTDALLYLTLPIVYSACPPLMGHTLCHCIFLDIIALCHPTRLSASPFLMLGSLRSFETTSLQRSYGRPLRRIPGTT